MIDFPLPDKFIVLHNTMADPDKISGKLLKIRHRRIQFGSGRRHLIGNSRQRRNSLIQRLLLANHPGKGSFYPFLFYPDCADF